MVINQSLTLVWSSATSEGEFTITDTKNYVPVATIATQDNAKLLQQLKSKINWDKYQSKVSTERQNQYLDILIDPIFKG